MRPPDENQNGSNRPNFMSGSRRAAGGDDNILARLERDAKRGPSAASWSNHARLAWCALAAVAVIGLVGVLASLAKENLATHQREAKAAPDLFANGGFAPLPGRDALATSSTQLVDLPTAPHKSKSVDRDEVPPLVMLKPAPAPAKTATVKTPAPVKKEMVKTPAPARMAASKPAAQPSLKTSPTARSAPTKLAAKSTPAKPAAPTRSAPPAPTHQAINTSAHPVVAVAPARKKIAPAAAPAKAEPAAVDSDVALLSAIIMHASRHAAERAQIEAAQCGAGKKCPQTEAAAALKATD